MGCAWAVFSWEGVTVFPQARESKIDMQCLWVSLPNRCVLPGHLKLRGSCAFRGRGQYIVRQWGEQFQQLS